MSERFKTREEAEKRRDWLNSRVQGGTEENGQFMPQSCPLLNGDCRTDCVCWQQARIVAYQEDEESELPFTVHSGYCGNAMFSEHEIAQG